MGLAPTLVAAPDTAAQTHALLRARSGFDIKQLVAEYRALRASVLRLWIDDCVPGAPHVEDMVRFNEAIDQALTESIDFFSAQVDQARNLLLGMLGHDMRSPLQSIQMTATYLAALNAGANVSQAASRLINSGGRMKALLDDLLDFNRTKMGLGIDIVPQNIDLARVFSDQVDELRAAHPDRRLELELVGNTTGIWDGRRLQQVLSNLVVNAFKYGAAAAPVRVAVAGDEDDVRVTVMNTGAGLVVSTLDQVFEPLQRGTDEPAEDGSLGLGLYIAREIVTAHGGEISARSDGGETTFAIRLPRRHDH